MSYYPGQNYQLRFTLVIAIALHGVILFGLAIFAAYSITQINQKEVTLSITRSEKKPEQAKFIAEHNQLASGEAEHNKELSSIHKALLADTKIRDTDLLIIPEAGALTPPRPPARVITTTAFSAHFAIVEPREKQLTENQNAPEFSEKSLAELSLAIASLEARLKNSVQTETRKPRVLRLTSTSALASEDAAYVHRWRDRVETIGNLHYPDEARKQQLYGNVRLLVKLRSNGIVEGISILEPSGSAILDRAAIESIRLASPFEPFHEELAARYERMDVIRTWQFRKDRVRAFTN
jgi:protein TonB